MQSHNGTIDGGNQVGSSPTDHWWGTFSFRDNWKTVTIINNSTRDLVIDDIDVLNTTRRPIVTEDTTGNAAANAKFAIVRQVDPSVVTITNTHTSGPNLVINGTITNPIGKTEITNKFGPISSTTIRGGTSSFYSLWPNLPESPPHSSLIETNILHLTRHEHRASSLCVTGEFACGTNGSKTLCIDPSNPCVNVTLIVWAFHPQEFTSVSGTNTFVDLKTILRDSTLPTHS